ASHIPGAVYAHLDEDLAAPVAPDRKGGRHPLPTPEEFARTLSGWGIDNEIQIVAYDDGPGAMAARFWWMLRWLGHDAVAVLDGGWAAWQAENRPVESGVPAVTPARFVPRPRPEMIVNADKALQYTASGGALLIDARAADRYRGENETLDPVGGHIPGASNHFYGQNLSDGRFRKREALAQDFRSLIGQRPASEIIHYCGSGVTACHNLLAMEHAGLGLARLYPGSWSDWSSDPSRPRGRG
ncbi:MAG: sulfurtransferase, partial [Caldilineaceae bacterium]